MLGDCTLYHGRAEAILPTLPAASVQLILVDPPYMDVKTEAWDRQWPTRDAYLNWLMALAKAWQRLLTPNGSLYCFASPQLAAWVEVRLSEVFHVLQRITWRKNPPGGGWSSKAVKEELRAFFLASEAILFCEPYATSSLAPGESGYQQAERHLKTSLFSAPIQEAMVGTHTTAKDVAEAIGAYGNVNHGGAVSNWLKGSNIPTHAHYEAMRVFFNTQNGRTDYLRQEYDDLRRPFTVSAAVPYTDVWDFATVHPAPDKHPCEKPLPLLRHIIMASSRPGDTVLDCCAGSFSTLVAAKDCGRKGIGIEQDRHWYRQGCARLAQETFFPLWEKESL
jgi:site-specific DNA-methyltransferase (adenine-specific)